MEELLSLSAATLTRRIRAGEVTPIEIVDAHITRIEAVNPTINGLVTPLFDQAREEARAATERLVGNSDHFPPLFGLPVTIKDALAVTGFDRLPSGLDEALDALEESELMKEALGEHIVEWFLRNKRDEWRRYRRHVSLFEIEENLPIL